MNERNGSVELHGGESNAFVPDFLHVLEQQYCGEG